VLQAEKQRKRVHIRIKKWLKRRLPRIKNSRLWIKIQIKLFKTLCGKYNFIHSFGRRPEINLKSVEFFEFKIAAINLNSFALQF